MNPRHVTTIGTLVAGPCARLLSQDEHRRFLLDSSGTSRLKGQARYVARPATPYANKATGFAGLPITSLEL